MPYVYLKQLNELTNLKLFIMENISIAIMHIELQIKELEVKLANYKKALQLLIGEVSVEEISTTNDMAIVTALPDSEEGLIKSSPEYHDYPSSEKLHVRMNYLDVKFPYAFTMITRKELLIRVEGRKNAGRYSNFSFDMKNLVNTGHYIGIKFNKNNRHQVYVKPNWINDEENNRHFVSGHQPKEEDIKHIPVGRRDLNKAEIIKEK